MSHTKSTHDSETVAKGQQVITACAFIHHNYSGVEKVFLAKRAMTKKFMPSVYELPGGHIDFGEDILQGLKRELQEEFAMKISIGDPFFVFTYINNVKQSHSIEIVYFATFIDPIDKILFSPDDHETYGWFGKEEIKTIEKLNRETDDGEIFAIRRGFALLETQSLNFG